MRAPTVRAKQIERKRARRTKSNRMLGLFLHPKMRCPENRTALVTQNSFVV